MTRCPLTSKRSFLDEEISDHQRVHAGAEKCSNRVGRRVYDCFAAKIERRVHDDGHARALPEFIDQPPVERIDLILYSLWPRSAVHSPHAWNYASFSLSHPPPPY